MYVNSCVKYTHTKGIKMTRKIYKSAMGKPVDLGALLLQNEQTRAVGNMNVNARGDQLDSANRVVEPKNRQVQRRYNKQSNVTGGAASSGTRSVKPAPQSDIHVADTFADLTVDLSDTFADLPMDEPEDIVAMTPQEQSATPAAAVSKIPEGGLAGAIARQREVKQELEKTRRQQQQGQGLRKI
jgi:hypothetical protein